MQPAPSMDSSATAARLQQLRQQLEQHHTNLAAKRAALADRQRQLAEASRLLLMQPLFVPGVGPMLVSAHNLTPAQLEEAQRRQVSAAQATVALSEQILDIERAVKFLETQIAQQLQHSMQEAALANQRRRAEEAAAAEQAARRERERDRQQEWRQAQRQAAQERQQQLELQRARSQPIEWSPFLQGLLGGLPAKQVSNLRGWAGLGWSE